VEDREVEEGELDEKDTDGKTDLDLALSDELDLHKATTTATTLSELRQAEAMLVNQRLEIENNFDSFRKDLAKAERNEFWTKLCIAAALFACFWLLGGAIFSKIEGWTYFQGFYFVFVVFSTMG
jgi:hypothetical protein